MIGENGTPVTPDWCLPASNRCAECVDHELCRPGCAHAGAAEINVDVPYYGD